MAVGLFSVWAVWALKWAQECLVDPVLDLALGYRTASGWGRERRRAGMEYEGSAQLVKIIYKGAYNAIWEHGTHNFFYFHERYVNPNYVLRHDNVTLQACTATHAVFAVTDPEVNVYDVAKHPFVMLAQYVECKRLVLVPLRAMYRLSEETGDPTDREIIGYGMTARSGSTLITKMFSRLPDTVAMSEPFALFHAHKWYSRGLIPEDDYPKLILALLRLQFKKLHHIPCKRMTIKLTQFISPQQEIMREVFPCMKLFFNARHPRASMRSYCHTLLSPAMGSMLTHQFHDCWPDSLAFDYKNAKLQAVKREAMRDKSPRVDMAAFARDCALMYGGAVDFYLGHRHLYLRCVLYENLVGNPEAEISELFGVLGLPSKHIPEALACLESHSQGFIFGDPKKEKRREFGPAEFREVDKAFEDIGLPLSTDMTVEEFKALMVR